MFYLNAFYVETGIVSYRTRELERARLLYRNAFSVYRAEKACIQRIGHNRFAQYSMRAKYRCRRAAKFHRVQVDVPSGVRVYSNLVHICIYIQGVPRNFYLLILS